MRNKAMGDFSTGSRSSNGMGDFWSDVVESVESEFQKIGASLEQEAQKKLEAAKAQLDPRLVEDIEEQIAKLGPEAEKQLKTQLANMTQEEVSKWASEQAAKKEYQDKAITTGVTTAANQISQYIISVKDSFREGKLFKNHPALVTVGVGVPSLLFLKWFIGKKRTKVVYANKSKKA